MLFTPCWKLFSFSRYLNFCLDFFGPVGKCLDKISTIIPKFMTTQTVKQIIMKYMFPNISRSKDNQTIVFDQLIEYNMRNNILKKSLLKIRCGIWSQSLL